MPQALKQLLQRGYWDSTNGDGTDGSTDGDSGVDTSNSATDSVTQEDTDTKESKPDNKPSESEAKLLKEIADKHDVPPELVQRHLDTELQHHGMKRRASIYNEIDKVMREDWRDIEEIVAEIEGENRIEDWKYDGIGGT